MGKSPGQGSNPYQPAATGTAATGTTPAASSSLAAPLTAPLPMAMPTSAQRGTIASSALPNPGGPGSKAKGSAPINYFKSQADIPQGHMGYIRPNANAIGVNRVGAIPPPVQQPRINLAQVINTNLHRGPGGASHGDRQGATTSGSGWGGNSSAGSGYGMGGRNK